MTQDVGRLQELLARVQRNAALPRILSPSGSGFAQLGAPSALAGAPLAAPEALVESAPPPSYGAALATSSGQAPLDVSVDELLLEDPFPSVPPPPPPSYSAILAEDPIPPQRAKDSEDVSGVSAVSDLNEQLPEELLDDDIVEVTPGMQGVDSGSLALDELDFGDEELDDRRTEIEQPPVSSSRSIVAGTLDEALAHAESPIDEGREVPLKTPPPESGPQKAAVPAPGMHAPLAPDIEALLESDLSPLRGGVNAAVPTAEQLGQTVDLEDARGPLLELDQPAPFSASGPLEQPLAPEELEVTLPQREYGGGYHEDLLPPPEARQELEAHRQRFGEEAEPESLAQYPSQQPESPGGGFAPAGVTSSVSTDSFSATISMVTIDAPIDAEFAPELLARPELGPGPVAKFIRAEMPRPNTFLELLDGSLALGRT